VSLFRFFEIRWPQTCGGWFKTGVRPDIQVRRHNTDLSIFLCLLSSCDGSIAIYSFTSGLEARSGRKTWLILTRSTLIRRALSTAHGVFHPHRLQLKVPRITIVQSSHTITMQLSAILLLFTATASVSAWVRTILPTSPTSLPQDYAPV